MAAELDELVEFLSSSRPEVRREAVSIVAGLAGSEDGTAVLATRAPALLPPLLRLLAQDQEVAAALVNLSANAGVAAALTQQSGVEAAVQLLLQPPAVRPSAARLLVMLLANLTREEPGARRMLQEDTRGEAKGEYLAKLLQLFLWTPLDKQREDLGACAAEDDAFEHVAAIMVNVTRLQAGRRLVLNAERALLKQILPQIESQSVVRRQGVAGTVRNCCFEAETQLANLLQTSEYLWPALLLPLAGSRAYSDADCKMMPAELAVPLSFERPIEEDPHVKVEAAEALYLIAMQEEGRQALWKVNAPRILQAGYEDEQDPQVNEAYERIGSLLVEESGKQEQQQ